MTTTLLRFLVFALTMAGLTLSAAAQLPSPPAAPSTARAAPAPAVEAASAARTGPAEVKIGVYINDIQAIDLTSHSFVGDIYVWFRDSDPAIDPGESFEWMNMFAPDDHVQRATYPAPQPQPDGSLYQVFRHQGPFAAKFSIRTYPFDKHVLAIDIEDQEWDANRLVYTADTVTMNPDIVLPGFVIGEPRLDISSRPYPTSFGDLAAPDPSPYSRATVNIPISRPVVSGVTKALLPVFIVVLVAAAALLLNPSHVEARVGLSITALLTLVALQFSAMASLPDVGYLLMLDQVYLASYGFVLLVVGLLVLTTLREDEVQASGVKSVARGGPVTAFLAVALYAAIIGAVLWWNLR